MKKIKAALPLIITLAGFLGIGALAVYRLVQMETPEGRFFGWTALAVYIGWKACEMRISAGEASRGEDHDRGTVELCAAVELALLVAAFAPYGEIGPVQGAAGLAVMALGLMFRAGAVRSLGERYSLRIRPIEGPPVSSGPYGMVRHPSYLGTLIVHTGLVILFFNLYSGIALALWFGAVGFRTMVEDRFLMKFPEYRAYAERVRWRLVPFIF